MHCPACGADWPDQLAIDRDANLTFTFHDGDPASGEAHVNEYDEYELRCLACERTQGGTGDQWLDVPDALQETARDLLADGRFELYWG